MFSFGDIMAEALGLILQNDGLPRIAGRLLGVFVLHGGPFSFSDLCEKLQVSRGSISTNTRLLETLGTIERVSKPGERQDFFRLAEEPYAQLIERWIGRSRKARETVDRAASAVPATLQPSGQTALVSGDNTAAPLLNFVENPEMVRPGDRVVTSGDGHVFPPGLLIGQVAQDKAGRLRVRLSADYERLEFLRVLRHQGSVPISDPGALIAPVPDDMIPLPRPDTLLDGVLPEAAGDEAENG